MIIQRFPEKDWKDTPFIDGIEWVIIMKYYNLLKRVSISNLYLFFLLYQKLRWNLKIK